MFAPFSTCDLYNRKPHNPAFSDNPDAFTNLISSIFITHQPTWEYFHQLLQVLFTVEKRSWKAVLCSDGFPTTDPDIVEEVFSLRWLDCDHNPHAGCDSLARYRRTLIQGFRVAFRRPTNLSKIGQIVQGPEEAPGAFIERLYQVYHLHSALDLEAPENS